MQLYISFMCNQPYRAYTVKRPGLFQLSLLASVAIRKHIKMSMYELGNFVDKHGEFGDKKGTLW